MSDSTSGLTTERQRSIEAVAQFLAMVHATEGGELAAAADAQRRLEQLGYRVRFATRSRATQTMGVARG